MQNFTQLFQTTQPDFDDTVLFRAENAGRLIYIADLPKSTTYREISDFYEQHIGTCDIKIKRSIWKDFYTACVQFHKPSDQVKALSSELRFPVLAGHQCRAIPYNCKEANTARIGQSSQTVQKPGRNTQLFVKGLPKDWQHSDLCAAFEPFGKVISCKVSILPDHSSRGFGYVQFDQERECQKALKAMHDKVVREADEDADVPECKLSVVEYVSKTDRNGTPTAAKQKMCSNNLYVKFFPRADWTEAEMQSTFEQFGEVGSAYIARDDQGESKQFGFVCFKRAEDAMKAIAHFSEKENSDEQQPCLYVREAKSKQQRMQEMAKLSYNFKKSMQWHNVIVKGLDESCSQDDFEEYFSNFGEVKSVKLIPEARTGFVCYVNKESAKNVLGHPDHMLQGKKLFVAQCKPKEERHIEIEEKVDRRNYESHRKAQLAGPHTEVIQLIQAMATMFAQGNRGGGGNPGGQRLMPRSNQVAPHPGQQQHNGGQRMLVQQRQQQYGYSGNHQPGMMPQPMMMPNPVGQHIQPQQSQIVEKYGQEIMRIYQQPQFMTQGEQVKKNLIGTHIYGYITQMVGNEFAPKITGMIVDLPMADLNQATMAYPSLCTKVRAAIQLLIDTGNISQEHVVNIPIMMQQSAMPLQQQLHQPKKHQGQQPLKAM